MTFELEPYVAYRGNKFGIVEQLYSTIRMLDIPQPLGIVDAFTGGGSFAYFMARKGYKVLANDIDEDLIELHNACKQTPEVVRSWFREYFTKETFNKVKNTSGAYAAYVRAIWSFSNNCKTYLTSTDKQDKKIADFLAGDAEPNARSKHIEDIILLWARNNLDLNFVSGSYENLTIPEGWLGYLDPPYQGVGGYRSGKFDHDKFYGWALNQPGLVLISEYEMPKEFFLVDEYLKWNEAGRGARTKQSVERLYSNKPVKKLTLF